MTLEEGVAGQQRRAKVLRAFLIAGLVIDALAILSGLSQRALLSKVASGIQIGDAAATANDTRQSVIGAFQVLAFLVTAVCWLVWFHRAYANLGLMGSRQSNHTPRGAVGYWFVPFVNLVRPYQITKELWQRSARRNVDEWVLEAVPSLLGSWWAVYLLSNIAGQIVFRMSVGAKTLDKLQAMTTVGVVADIISVASAFLALAVVRGIDRLQTQALSDVPSAVVPGVIA